jgi:hypothetical protein
MLPTNRFVWSNVAVSLGSNTKLVVLVMKWAVFSLTYFDIFYFKFVTSSSSIIQCTHFFLVIRTHATPNRSQDIDAYSDSNNAVYSQDVSFGFIPWTEWYFRLRMLKHPNSRTTLGVSTKVEMFICAMTLRRNFGSSTDTDWCDPLRVDTTWIPQCLNVDRILQLYQKCWSTFNSADMQLHDSAIELNPLNYMCLGTSIIWLYKRGRNLKTVDSQWQFPDKSEKFNERTKKIRNF